VLTGNVNQTALNEHFKEQPYSVLFGREHGETVPGGRSIYSAGPALLRASIEWINPVVDTRPIEICVTINISLHRP
jgi:hypothetical protein